ncbi:MAG: 3-phosphoshikimate 1-carboxyvinyltransferase [Bacteroidales bacterium]|jgi:3-phosphoshikimate 1-carboxyvinyltransferase|nr:3-phosphoshikimate 1-carboxyvinyltransferase [Bacteroidales bacterium]
MKTIFPSRIAGSLPAPASKSMMQRAIAIATLAQGTSILHGYTPSNDSDAALGIAHDLGAEVQKNGETISIQGNFAPRTSILNCGEAGLGIRMFTPIAALWHKTITLEGEGSLKTRPIDTLVQPLRDLGVNIETNNTFVPVQVQGPMQGGTAYVNGNLSSQILTGLLIASAQAQSDTMFVVKDLKSKPYIDMTMQIMGDFGVRVDNENYQRFFVKSGQQYRAQNYYVEGDWSGASFLLVAGALGGSVTVTNVRKDSTQADIAMIDALKNAGARVEWAEQNLTVSKQNLRAFTFDATECPDLFPPLVALAVHCIGTTRIRGVERLFHKESNRAEVLQKEFARVGAHIEIHANEMLIHGGELQGGRIFAHNDHRIAMAAACAAICAKNPIEIENHECVAKSYPHFFDDFARIQQ